VRQIFMYFRPKKNVVHYRVGLGPLNYVGAAEFHGVTH